VTLDRPPRAQSTRATIGMDFCARQLNVDVLSASENSVVQRLTVQVWDTAGQEQYHSITATYYRKAGGVMIVYDAQVRSTFDSLKRWIEQVDENAEGVVKMVVAAKCEGDMAVSEAEGRAFAEQHGCLFAAVSSKLGEGVLPAFKSLSSHVLAAQESRDVEREGIWLNARPDANAGGAAKGGCC
jgi:small GTP-binding protein